MFVCTFKNYAPAMFPTKIALVDVAPEMTSPYRILGQSIPRPTSVSCFEFVMLGDLRKVFSCTDKLVW